MTTPFTQLITQFYGPDLSGSQVRMAIAAGTGLSADSVKRFISGGRHPSAILIDMLTTLSPFAARLDMPGRPHMAIMARVVEVLGADGQKITGARCEPEELDGLLVEIWKQIPGLGFNGTGRYAALADGLGITTRTVSRWKTGASRLDGPEAMIIRAAAALGKTISYPRGTKLLLTIADALKDR
jgi:hypothetical protein